MQKLLFILAFFFILVRTQAQNPTDVQLAEQYFRQGDYEKALVYYEKFYSDNPAPHYFVRMYDCLVQLDRFKEAEKAMKKQMKREPNNLMYGIRLGELYEKQADSKNAGKAYNDVISNLKANQQEIITVAREFSRLNKFDYALKAFERGKELVPNFYVFNFEIADLYGQMGQDDRMIDMYLEMLSHNSAYLQTVQNMLNRNIDFTDDTKLTGILRERLLRSIQQKPDEPVFSEMLIWLYLQQNDFGGALTQVKALDKRYRENGERVMNLGYMALQQKQYKHAADAFSYVASKGMGLYYRDAQLASLNARKLEYENSFEVPTENYVQLVKDYEQLITQLGSTPQAAKAERDVAQIEALRLNQPQKAIDRLQLVLKRPRVPDDIQAYMKIDLGDYLLQQGEEWEAALYYLQAEKDFKYDEIGEIAKFKAAKVYYYKGEFAFAKAQLDVLKGSTSKLIANDALFLSNLIQDNTGTDTTEVPMQMYAQADLLVEQKRYKEAINVLDSIIFRYPGHPLADDILFLKHKIALQQNEVEKAIGFLEKIVNNYGSDILADDALFALGELYEKRLNDSENARKYYEKLLLNHTDSLFITEARKRYRTLRGDVLE